MGERNRQRSKLERVKGRRAGSGHFAMLMDDMMQCEAVATLPLSAFKVWAVVAAQYRGNNNGAITLSREAARRYGIKSSDTLAKGLAILRERGIIVMTFPGSYQPPLPARYAIAWKPYDDTDYSRKGMIVNDYARWPDSPTRKIDHADRPPVPAGTAHRSREAS